MCVRCAVLFYFWREEENIRQEELKEEEKKSLTGEIDSRKMLSWGEKGRESAERNRMKQGRVEQN